MEHTAKVDTLKSTYVRDERENKMDQIEEENEEVSDEEVDASASAVLGMRKADDGTMPDWKKPLMNHFNTPSDNNSTINGSSSELISTCYENDRNNNVNS